MILWSERQVSEYFESELGQPVNIQVVREITGSGDDRLTAKKVDGQDAYDKDKVTQWFKKHRELVLQKVSQQRFK